MRPIIWIVAVLSAVGLSRTCYLMTSEQVDKAGWFETLCLANGLAEWAHYSFTIWPHPNYQWLWFDAGHRHMWVCQLYLSRALYLVMYIWIRISSTSLWNVASFFQHTTRYHCGVCSCGCNAHSFWFVTERLWPTPLLPEASYQSYGRRFSHHWWSG